VSTDANKVHDNVVVMPDIYDSELKLDEPANEAIEPPELDDGESAGFDPYDTARMHKDKLRSS
jgi:hypothetical protein